MKRFIVAFAVSAALLLSGCTSETQYGKCVGVADDHDPRYVYQMPVTNVVVAIVFFQTIVVPVYVLIKETSCPIGPSPYYAPAAK